jgi:hypothetical protein
MAGASTCCHPSRPPHPNPRPPPSSRLVPRRTDGGGEGARKGGSRIKANTPHHFTPSLQPSSLCPLSTGFLASVSEAWNPGESDGVRGPNRNRSDPLNSAPIRPAPARDSAMDAGEGLLRLTPTWVPRSFLHPGRRIKLHPGDYYRFGADRGGIDERWFGSTTEAANEGRVWHEGLSFCLFEGQKFLLKDAVAERATTRRRSIFAKYNAGRCIRSSLTTWDRFPTTCTRAFEDAKLVGQEGKPESYYFPPQLNNVDNNFAYTFMGLGTGHGEGRRPPLFGKLERRRQRDPRSEPRVSAEAGHRLADPARRAARPRFALHVRTAVGQRRVRHVPIDRRRPLRALVAAGQGHARGQAPGPRLHRRPARLGQERRYALQAEQLLEPIRDERAAATGTRPVDRLRHGRRPAVVQRQGIDDPAGSQSAR